MLRRTSGQWWKLALSSTTKKQPLQAVFLSNYWAVPKTEYIITHSYFFAIATIKSARFEKRLFKILSSVFVDA